MTFDPKEALALVERLDGYTPGPWHYRPQKYDDWGYVRGPQEDDGWKPFICQAKDPRSTEGDERLARRNGADPWEANARLIAAAPDLHAHLTAALDEIERMRGALSELADCVDDGCYCSEMKMATAVDEARAALKGGGQ